MIIVLLDRSDRIAPTHFDRRAFGLCPVNPFKQKPFEIGLLKVDKGGIAVTVFGEQVEGCLLYTSPSPRDA